MIRIRYKSGWLRFRTIDELADITGWSFDRIVFALRTNTAILGVDLCYGQPKSKTTKKTMIKTSLDQPKYQDLKNELRMVNKRKKSADRVIGRYEATWFPGRIETNEIKHARAESKRLEEELLRLKKAIDHYKRYEQRRKNKSEKAA